MKHLRELDGIRAIAALMVMFFHFFQGLITKNAILLSLQKYSIWGQTGVSLFFVLSGFLITRILLNTKSDNFYFSNFYFRRAVRIFPLYYLFLSLYFFVIPVITNLPLEHKQPSIYYWVYLQNIAMTFNWKISGPSHLWSLAVEEHFYIFWPVLIYFFNKRKMVLIIIALIICSFLIRLLLISNNFGVFYFTFSRLDELSLGGLLAIFEVNGRLKTSNSSKFGLSFLFTLSLTLLLWKLTSGKEVIAAQSIKFILLAFCYFSLIGFVVTAKNSNWFKKFLQAKVLLYTGKISYGLYVYHPLCFALLNFYFKDIPVAASFIGSFSLAFLVASLSYYFFESKFLLLKKYFNYNETKVVSPNLENK